MIKRILRIFSIILLLFLCISGIFLYGIYVTVENVTLTYQTMYSDLIPDSMVDKTIAYISDIQYNEYMNKERLTKMIDKYNKSSADIVIFGGDLFSNPDQNPPDSQVVLELTEILKTIKAPLGKFAVLGESDQVNDETKAIAEQILFDSDFEIITNSSVKVRNNDTYGISLIGIDSEINGSPEPDLAFQNISEDTFNIMVTHCPDTVNRNDINIQYLNLILAGHSLGGQIYLPLLGPLQRSEGAHSYPHGLYNISGKTLIVSNGLGTKNYDMRLFAPPQIIMIRLQQAQE